MDFAYQKLDYQQCDDVHSSDKMFCIILNKDIRREVYLQVSLVIGVAVKSQREEGAWSEGVAIWVAVFIVSLVGNALLKFQHSSILTGFWKHWPFFLILAFEW